MIISELRDKLEEKRKELEEAEQKLKAEGAVSAKSKYDTFSETETFSLLQPLPTNLITDSFQL